MAGFLVSMDGCPYAFSTAGVSAATSTDADWGGWTLVPAALAWPSLDWSERMKPLDGALEVDGLTIKLHDVQVDGERILTSMFTRNPRRLLNAQITSTLSAVDMAIPVTRDPGFSTGAQVIYIDQEAISCSAFDAGTLTFEVVQRGIYGSRAVEHFSLPNESFAATVWADFPSLTRRRVVLWFVDDDGIASPLWRGYCNRAPRLAGDGISFELQCEHAWTVERAQPVGPKTYSTNVTGYAWRALGLAFNGTDLFSGLNNGASIPGFGGNVSADWGLDAAASWGEALSKANADGLAQWQALGRDNDGVNTEWVESEISRGTRFVGRAKNYGAFVLYARHPGASGERVPSTDMGSGTHEATIDVDFKPKAMIPLLIGNQVQTLRVSRTATFESVTSWSNVAIGASDDYPHQTTVQPLLRALVKPADVNAECWLYVYPSAVDGATGTVTAKIELQPIDRSVQVRTRHPSEPVWLFDPVPLSLAMRVTSTHWIYAIRRGLFNTPGVRSYADARNWSFDAARDIAANAGGTLLGDRRTWIFDGTKKFGELIVDLLALHGAGLGVRAGGRIAPVLFRAPLPTSEIAARWTHADYVVGKPPKFTTMPDGIANTLVLKAANATVVLNNQDSVSKYGPARTIELKVSGTDEEMLTVGDPVAAGLTAGGRILGLWSEPADLVTLTLSFGRARGIYIGDFVEFDGVNVPDGAGNRGCTANLGQVIGRRVGLSTNTIEFEVIRYGQIDLAGWAPCVRISAISDVTVSVDTTYLATTGTGPTDFAGSNMANYRYRNTAPNDGGTSWFRVGDRVRLVTVDTTTPTIEGPFTVMNVYPLTKEIELNEAPTITGNFIVMEYDRFEYAGESDTQRGFAFVADITDELIDDGSSGTDGKRFGP